MKYLSPRSDMAFKKLFGSKDHKELTIKFLNAMLQLPVGKQIEKIDFQDTTSFSTHIEGREIAFDVYCTDEQNNHFIIEMQALNEYDFFERSQYYIARALAAQLKKTDPYKGLLPVIFVGIVNYNLDYIHKNKRKPEFRSSSIIKLEEWLLQSKDVISQYSLINRVTGEILPVPLMELHFVQLPKFEKTIDQCKNIIDEWLFFMKNAETCTEIPEQMKQSELFTEAFNIIAQKNWTKEEFEKYVKELDAVGKEERIQEGAFEQGFDEGFDQAFEVSKQKTTEKFAIKLLKKKMPIDDIIELTGLSVKEIEELHKNIKK